MAKSNEERFWENVKKTKKCWLWKGGKTSGGYGAFNAANNIHGAHRYSYELHNGPIPEGLWVLHTCDNPSCVNPAHLFIGTQQENIEDMIEKGRGNFAKGEAHYQDKLTWREVRLIRKIYKKHSFSKTQQQLADRFGVNQQTISEIIRGDIWKE